MEQIRIPKPGEIYHHFKGMLYQILTVAIHSETKELMVVYQALYGDFKTYVRPLEMFISEVDHIKYPDVKQKYRFELKVSSDELVKVSTEESSTKEKIGSKLNSSNAIEVKIQIDNSSEIEKTDSASSVIPETQVNSLLIKFLDAESYTKKLEVLTTNKKHITDRIINDMAVALDCAVDEGPIDKRIQELISCLEAKRRFEDRRFR